MAEPFKRIKVTFEVASEAEAAELDAAWRQIIAGDRSRLNAAAEDLNEIIDRSAPALVRILTAIQKSPGSGQARRLVHFLAAIYNGQDYHFDLTDLRALDSDLAGACIDYLNYDRLGKSEVHKHMPGGGEQMQRMLEEYGIRPELHFSAVDRHESRLNGLATRLSRNPNDFLQAAVEDELWRSEAKVYGTLLVKQSSHTSLKVIHARALADSGEKPLCGATDGPWTAESFNFFRLSCDECRARVLHPVVQKARP